MKVVLDTSFILACGQKKKDYLQEIKRAFGKVEFIVPSAVIRELNLVKKRFSGISKAILEKHGYRIEECEGSADNCVLEVAKKKKAAVASFDAKLRKRAREIGLRVITVRKGAYVMDELT